jgi:hypothetical protein
MNEQTIQGETTEFGFQWGAAEVTRLISDKDAGWIMIGVESPKMKLQIYVTKSGKIRVHQADGTEWLPEKAKRRKR